MKNWLILIEIDIAVASESEFVVIGFQNARISDILDVPTLFYINYIHIKRSRLGARLNDQCLKSGQPFVWI